MIWITTLFQTLSYRLIAVNFLPSPYLLVCSVCDLFVILNDGNIYSILHFNVDAEISNFEHDWSLSKRWKCFSIFAQQHFFQDGEQQRSETKHSWGDLAGWSFLEIKFQVMSMILLLWISVHIMYTKVTILQNVPNNCFNSFESRS